MPPPSLRVQAFSTISSIASASLTKPVPKRKLICAGSITMRITLSPARSQVLELEFLVIRLATNPPSDRFALPNDLHHPRAKPVGCMLMLDGTPPASNFIPWNLHEVLGVIAGVDPTGPRV